MAPTMTSSTAWLRDGASVERTRGKKASERQGGHETPGHDDGLGDRNRSDREQRLRGKGRSDHGCTPNRRTAVRAARMPAVATSSGKAPK